MTGVVLFGGLLLFMLLSLPVCFSILTACINMVVYGATMGLSVSKMFIGGVMPGLLIALGLIGVNVFLSFRHDFAKEDTHYTASDILRRAFRALPTLVLPVIILGGIYGGIVTPPRRRFSAWYTPLSTVSPPGSSAPRPPGLPSTKLFLLLPPWFSSSPPPTCSGGSFPRPACLP